MQKLKYCLRINQFHDNVLYTALHGALFDVHQVNFLWQLTVDQTTKISAADTIPMSIQVQKQLD